MAPVFGHGRLRLYLLKLLEEFPRHGYELIRLLEDRFMGLYVPSAGTIYPRLQRLEAEGLITHEVVGGRKVYWLTDAGRAELHDRVGELGTLEAEIADSVRDLAKHVGDGLRDTARDLRDELGQTAGDTDSARPGGPGRAARREPVWASFLSYLEQRGAAGQSGEPAVPGEPGEPAASGEHPTQPPAASGGPDRPAGATDEEEFQRRLQDFRDQARDAVHDALRGAAPVSAARLRECADALTDALTLIHALLDSED